MANRNKRKHLRKAKRKRDQENRARRSKYARKKWHEAHGQGPRPRSDNPRR